LFSEPGAFIVDGNRPTEEIVVDIVGRLSLG
jgi:hypothetical protein